MTNQAKSPLPLPDKKIPVPVMIIGTFELAVALLGLIILVLFGQADEGSSIAFLILLLIYGAMGAGLWAIQEWARASNVILHAVAVPYVLYTSIFLGAPSGWAVVSQVLISIAIVFALTRPMIHHKFKTVVPKKRDH